MRKNRFATLLMLAGLLAGQWLVVAHAQQHSALAGSDAACEMCLHGQGPQSGLAPTLPSVAPHVPVEAPAANPQTSASFTAPRYQPIRAPPALLA